MAYMSNPLLILQLPTLISRSQKLIKYCLQLLILLKQPCHLFHVTPGWETAHCYKVLAIMVEACDGNVWMNRMQVLGFSWLFLLHDIKIFCFPFGNLSF